MSGPVCYYCEFNVPGNMRPYGPGGAWVCFDCAFETPEREEQAKAAFAALLDAAEAISPTGIAMIGLESGPVPFDPSILKETL